MFVDCLIPPTSENSLDLNPRKQNYVNPFKYVLEISRLRTDRDKLFGWLSACFGLFRSVFFSFFFLLVAFLHWDHKLAAKVSLWDSSDKYKYFKYSLSESCTVCGKIFKQTITSQQTALRDGF